LIKKSGLIVVEITWVARMLWICALQEEDIMDDMKSGSPRDLKHPFPVSFPNPSVEPLFQASSDPFLLFKPESVKILLVA
jgi:hypothetical protein